MGEKFKKWSCYLCGDIVIEGQRFGWIPEKGFVHMECLYEYIAKSFGGRIPSDISALLELEEIAGYGIVRVKQIESIISEELKGQVESGRHKLEGLSALAGKLLKETLKKYGIEL